MRFAKNTQQDTSKVLRLPRKMPMDTSKVLRLPRKLQHIFLQRHKSIAPAMQNDFRHVPEHVWMSRSATPATRNEATTRLQPPKRTTSPELPIGTAIRGSRERLRTVANGLRTRKQRRANTPSTPRPPEWNGNPCYAFGKTLLIVWQPFNLGLVKNGWIDSIRDCSCANSTNNNTHNKACCNVYANVFPPVTMDRNVDVAALFGAAKATICRVLPVLFDMDCRQVSWSNPSNYTAYPNHSWSR